MAQYNYVVELLRRFIPRMKVSSKCEWRKVGVLKMKGGR